MQHVSKIVLIALLAAWLAAGSTAAGQTHVENLTARQAADLIAGHRRDPSFVILDVRTPVEFKAGHIQGAVLMDYYDSNFAKRLKRLDRRQTYLIYCRSGARSGRTLQLIKDLGFGRVYHLARGILSWRREKLPLVKESGEANR